MIIIQKITKCQFHAAIFCEGCRTCYKSCGIAVGSSDIFSDILGSLLFQLNIAALRNGYKAILNFTSDTPCGVGKQCCEFILKIIFLVCLADEIQNGQAFLILCQTQTTSKLLQKDGQRLGWTQE